MINGTDARLSSASGELPTERGDGGARDEGDPRAELACVERYALAVVAGPDAGATYVIDASAPARVLVGKSPLCDLRLTDPHVSRRHVSLRALGSTLVLTDLGSTNGTTINGVAVREAALAGGEAIRVGRTVISVERRAPGLEALGRSTAFGRVLGGSRVMRRLFSVLAALAESDAPVLLEGEAGVGKELCAEEIHAASRRGASAMQVVPCHAMSGPEIEHRLAELVDGAAAGGAVFVDELGAVPLASQRRLARHLASSRGEHTRFYFASRRDLDRDAAAGRASDELLALLALGRVDVPPLRDRTGDVALLAEAFWRALVESDDGEPARVDPENGAPRGALPPDFLSRFEHYPWPGNVRELASAVAVRFRLGAFAPWRTSDVVRGDDAIGAIVDRELPLSDARRQVLDVFEYRYVQHMMARHGSTRQAARASGVALRYFQLLRARNENS